MRWLIVLSLALLLVLGFAAYQSPQVRELFEPLPRRPAVPARPTPPSRVEGESRAPTPLKREPTPPAPKPKEPEVLPAPAQVQPASSKPTVPNEEVSKVLTGVFRARQIYGVSLRVTDETIEVAGPVASEQQREMILGILEKARETRRIDSEGLLVRKTEPQ